MRGATRVISPTIGIHWPRAALLIDDSALFEGLPLPPWRVRRSSNCPRKWGFRSATGWFPAGGAASRHVRDLHAETLAGLRRSVRDALSRLGRYLDRLLIDPSVEAQASIATLTAAVAGLGSTPPPCCPESMRIDFQQAGSGAGGADLFEKLAERLDKLISKAGARPLRRC
ncbi:MAG: hypothetical protein IPI57_12240 [Candidatus Competibacteraceae bacterium]|nr:hypothetical protein [Candidatus Competibacteraceae bacterium]